MCKLREAFLLVLGWRFKTSRSTVTNFGLLNLILNYFLENHFFINTQFLIIFNIFNALMWTRKWQRAQFDTSNIIWDTNHMAACLDIRRNVHVGAQSR